MTNATRREELARAEIAGLLPVREQLSRRASVLRLRHSGANGMQRDALGDKAERCERVVHRLDARIRLAAEILAIGAVAGVTGPESAATGSDVFRR